jgi:hypothetical protein
MDVLLGLAWRWSSIHFLVDVVAFQSELISLGKAGFIEFFERMLRHARPRYVW